MSAMCEYIDRAETPEKKAHLQQQWKDATGKRVITCWCGQKRALEMAYRCLYCGAWFCVPCAETHFGQTIQRWVIHKRIAKRNEIECGIMTMSLAEGTKVFIHRDGRVICNGHEVYPETLKELMTVVIERLKQHHG